MPAHTVKCPECRTNLKSSRPIPVGKLLTCPKCDVLFAAPKPVLDAEVIEEVEVVEDVDVIEDVEVLDDDTPPRKPARKPAAAVKPSRVNAGIEVVEDDEDDEPRPSLKKPAPRPKRKSGGGGAKVVLIVSAAVLGLAVLGGAAWLAFWLLGGGGDEPLAYVPADSTLVIGVDGQALLSSPFGANIEQALNSPLAGPFARYKQETNTPPRELFQKVVVGLKFQGADNKGTIVLKANANWDAAKLAKAFGNPTTQSVGGYAGYKVSMAGSPTTLTTPNKHVAVLSDLPENELSRVLKSGGKKSPLTGDLATLAEKFGSGAIWLVAAPDPAMRDQFMAGFNSMAANNPGAQQAQAALQSVKGLGVAANVTGGQVDLRVGFLCPDAGAAQQLTSQIQSAAPQLTAALGAIAIFKPNLKQLATELKDGLKFTTDGTLAVISAQLSISSLQTAAGDLNTLVPTPGAPPMSPPSTPPGDQPKDKGRDRGGKGGGGKGGRGKGKGGGG